MRGSLRLQAGPVCQVPGEDLPHRHPQPGHHRGSLGFVCLWNRGCDGAQGRVVDAVNFKVKKKII